MPVFKKPIFTIPVILILVVIMGFLLFNAVYSQKTISFNDFLHDHFKERVIQSVFILKTLTSGEYSYSGVSEIIDIDYVMKSLPEIQMMKDSSSRGFPDYPNYQLTISGESQKLYVSFIISDKEILLHDYEKKENYSYKITNEFNLDKLEFLDPLVEGDKK